MTQTKEPGHVVVVDCLRGIAALAVCCVHLGPWPAVTRYGWLGVDVFFVISGFVVPYSLYRAGYRIRSYHRFIAKRMVRLDPPYFFSMALAIALHYLAYQVPQYNGPPPNYTAAQILLHVGYLNSFFSKDWIVVVYWSLGIEFQYYVLVGLLYPLIASRRVAAQLAVVALCVLAMDRVDFRSYGSADQGPLIGHYAFMFLLGAMTFRYRVGLMGRRVYLAAALVAAVAVAAGCGVTVGIVALAAAWTIAFASFEPKVLVWLGSISYSLYLTHAIVGGKFLNIALRVIHPAYGQVLAQISAVLVSLLFAYWMARVIEAPAKRLASRIVLVP